MVCIYLTHGAMTGWVDLCHSRLLDHPTLWCILHTMCHMRYMRIFARDTTPTTTIISFQYAILKQNCATRGRHAATARCGAYVLRPRVAGMAAMALRSCRCACAISVLSSRVAAILVSSSSRLRTL